MSAGAVFRPLRPGCNLCGHRRRRLDPYGNCRVCSPLIRYRRAFTPRLVEFCRVCQHTRCRVCRLLNRCCRAHHSGGT